MASPYLRLVARTPQSWVCKAGVSTTFLPVVLRATLLKVNTRLGFKS